MECTIQNPTSIISNSETSLLSPQGSLAAVKSRHLPQFYKNFSGTKRSLETIQSDCLAIQRSNHREWGKRAASFARQNHSYSRVCRIESSSRSTLLPARPPTPPLSPLEIRLSRGRGFIIDAVTPSSWSSRLLVRSSLLLLHCGWVDARVAALARFPPLDCLRAQFPMQFRLRTPTGIIFLSIFYASTPVHLLPREIRWHSSI